MRLKNIFGIQFNLLTLLFYAFHHASHDNLTTCTHTRTRKMSEHEIYILSASSIVSIESLKIMSIKRLRVAFKTSRRALNKN